MVDKGRVGAPLDSQYRQASAQEGIEEQLVNICSTLGSIATALIEIATVLQSGKIVGIKVEPGVPVLREERSPAEVIGRPIEPRTMHIRKTREKTMTNVSLSKKTKSAHAPLKAPKGFKALNFQFQDNGDDTCTVFGVDASGNQLDISAIATLTPAPTSSDTTILTVDTVSGMTFMMHAVGKLSVPGTPVVVTATATWNDGSAGPFTFSLPVDVISGGPVGILIVPGTPTVH